MLPTTLLLSIFATTVVSQSTPAVVCVPGQCIQGYSNVSIGASLSGGSSNTTLRLLPGEYTTNTNPKLLHDLLVSSSSKLSSSPGFSSANLSPLPLNLKLEPGLAIYSSANYSGQGGFTSLPSSPIPANSSTPIPANSLAISENVWVAVSSGSNAERVVLWESVPDITQLSLGASSSNLNLLDMQSTACTPACSSSGICNSSGQCICPPNFSGSSCESCAAGHFGATCQPCPEGCSDCDEGMSGSGRCLSVSVGPTDPKQCNCVNGECNTDGSCACNKGWIDGPETKCSACEIGFFLSTTGSCTACQLGCNECQDETAQCDACKPGFQENPNDRTKCDPIQQTSSGGRVCPPATFTNGANCDSCATECDSCDGPGSGDCLTCSRGLFMADGRCVATDANGVCAGTNGLVADNLKRVCDACPSKCSSCSIPGFTGGSSIDDVQCTQCTPGSVLSNGRCVDTCPDGQFVNPQDNLTCIPCDSSCGTCAGSATFCTSCSGSLFASNGQCVQSCPQSSFSSTSSTTPPRNICTPCHPDCATCSGSSFSQCTTCSSSRPVLSAPTGSTSGRCLPTCNKNQFFDAQSRECKSCDGSCGSCTGPTASACLSCQSPSQVVRNGQCVEANCSNGSSVVPGLGICLSSLVVIPSETNKDGEPLPPLPTITGISEPAPKDGGKLKLQWWQILLMALGCAFIFVMFLWCFRRRMRKQRKARTEMFAKGKGLKDKRRFFIDWSAGWRGLFGRKNKKTNAGQDGELPIAYNHQDVALREMTMKEAWREREEENVKKPKSKASKKTLRDDGREDDLDSYINAYDYSRRSVALSVKSHTPSTLPDLDGFYPSRRGNNNDRDRLRRQVTGQRAYRDLDNDSMYSEVTGQNRNTPEPRQPVKSDLVMPSFASSRRSPSPPPIWNSNNKLRKYPGVVHGNEDESVVIAPRPVRQQSDEAVLVDLLDSPEAFKPYHQVPRVTPPPLLPPIQPLATFASLQQHPTEAQAYAMAVKPSLQTQPQQQPQYTLAWVPTQMTGSSAGSGGIPVVGPHMTGSSSTTLGGGAGAGYWLNQPPVNQNVTGSSNDSKNPFRQGAPF
ncbi:FRAS1 protein [Coprinopsis sp. MPI-PUGE-AT-0042]|nr:FRAS1 protein [Coprinopsis sp. MPI-PUGE-AT-0042]